MQANRRLKRDGAAAACCALALLATDGAVAQQERPITVRLDTALVWDTNVFRVPADAPDPQAALGRPGRSDRLARATLGLRLDKSYAQQQWIVDLARTATRYEKFTSLDRDFFSYRAAWNWRLTPRIAGALSADRSQSEVQFEDVRGIQRIVATTTNRSLTADAWLFGGWHVLGGVAASERKNSIPFVSLPDVHLTGADLGVRYVARSEGSVTVTLRSRQGSQFGDAAAFVAGGFSEREHEVAAVWPVTGRSSLSGRLTRISRRHDDLPQRDFSGTGGELRYSWMPTGRLNLGLAATRNVAPFLLGTAASFRVEDALAFTPSWQVSDKVVLRMNAFRRSTNYLGAIVPPAGGPRRDVLRSVELAASWTPHRRIAVGASLRQERRTSTDAAFGFENTSVGLTAQVRF